MEAYLKKLCFEYQVDEKEVKELLARMEMVYLDKGKELLLPQCLSRACILLFPASCIPMLLVRERIEPSDSCLKVTLYYVTIPVHTPLKR